MVDQNPAQAWLDQVIEAPIDPDQRIIDPHHHLWRRPEGRLLGSGPLARYEQRTQSPNDRFRRMRG